MSLFRFVSGFDMSDFNWFVFPKHSSTDQSTKGAGRKMGAPIKFYYDLLSQPSRALYIFFKLAKIPVDLCPVALRKGEIVVS